MDDVVFADVIIIQLGGFGEVQSESYHNQGPFTTYGQMQNSRQINVEEKEEVNMISHQEHRSR
jgi:hypothetical protein